MEYRNTPDGNAPNRITLLLSPVTFRATYMMDRNLNHRFGVDSGKHWLSTVGPMVMLENRYKLTSDITLGSRLELFGNILEMHDPFITVDWKVNLDIRLTRHFSLGLETWLIYDPNTFFDIKDKPGEQERRWQFQQSAVLRFVYRITG
jgi:hypothetical protein